MKVNLKLHLPILLILFSFISAGLSFAQDSVTKDHDGNFIECMGFVDDRVGLLNQNDIAMIKSFSDLAIAHSKINIFTLILHELSDNMDVVLSDEMVQYLDHRGLDFSKSMIIVLIPGEKQVHFKGESFLNDHLSVHDITTLSNMLVESMESDDIVHGVSSVIDWLPRMPSLEPAVIADKEARAEKETEWIEFITRFDDRAGIILPEDMKKIEEAALKQENMLGIKAYLLIIPLISEWDFHDFGKRQFTHWQSLGHTDSKSYLILISHNNQKLEIVRGSYISFRDDDYEIRRLRDRLHMYLQDDKYATGIIFFIESMNEMRGLKETIEMEDKIKEKGTWYMLIGILILIAVFMRMGYMRRMQEANRAAQKRK